MWRCVLAAFMLMGTAAPALSAQTCPANGRVDPKIVISIQPAAAVYRNDLNQNELTALTAKQRRSNYGASRKTVTAGLTRAEGGHQVSVQAKIYAIKRGSLYCGWLSEIDVKLFFKSMTVNVAKEYHPGTCEYTAVIDHENKHVTIFRRNMDIYARKIKDQLRAAVQKYGAAYGGSQQEIPRAFMAESSRVIKPLLAQMSDQAEREHAQLDSPGSYQYTQGLCKGWKF